MNIIVPRHEPTCYWIAKWVCVGNHVGEKGTPTFGCHQKRYEIMEPIEDEE